MKKRIGILGIGGVGGYFGGLLAQAYFNSETIEIVFIARGETQNQIAQNGLTIKDDVKEITVFPKIVSNDPLEIGVLDYLICATKTYDIEPSLIALKDCFKPETVILPLYNGVDAPERIEKIFSQNTVLKGCVYIVSMIEKPGVIRKIGIYEKLFFGSPKAPISLLNELQSIFENAGIVSYLETEIESTVWEKYLFISALASVSCFYDAKIGTILNNPDYLNLFQDLINENNALAKAKGIHLDSTILEQTIEKLKKSPATATSSMHRDLMDGKKIELESLTEYVVNEGIRLNVATPKYQLVLEKLKNNKI